MTDYRKITVNISKSMFFQLNYNCFAFDNYEIVSIKQKLVFCSV